MILRPFENSELAAVPQHLARPVASVARRWRSLISHLEPSRVHRLATVVTPVDRVRVAVTVAGLAFLLFPATTRCKLLAGHYDLIVCADCTRSNPH